MATVEGPEWTIRPGDKLVPSYRPIQSHALTDSWRSQSIGWGLGSGSGEGQEQRQGHNASVICMRGAEEKHVSLDMAPFILEALRPSGVKAAQHPKGLALTPLVLSGSLREGAMSELPDGLENRESTEVSNQSDWLTADGQAEQNELGSQGRGSATASGHWSPVRPTAHLVPPESRADEAVQVEGLVALEHEVEGTGELGGEDGEGLLLAAVPFDQLRLELLSLRVGAEEESGSL